ncbi:hypothetical protein COO60DRAFT_1554659 [Scenedesmus sp. NREL 46B-D3]|nr:hypothetical protein COO60DRAFT_1554659 [Scenedesmus sp. NREL 46B-D3]
MLQNLPLQQLLLLLTLGEVSVAHEDTVLYTLASNVNISSMTQQQKQQVARAVRPAHLTPEALLLLPKLEWMLPAYGAEECVAGMYHHYIACKYGRSIWVIDDGSRRPHVKARRRPRSTLDNITVEFAAPIAQVVAIAEQALSQGRDRELVATVAAGSSANQEFAGRSWQARFLVYQAEAPKFGLGLEVRPAFPAVPGGGGVVWCPMHSGIVIECLGSVTAPDGPWLHNNFELVYVLPQVRFTTASELAAQLGPLDQLLVASMFVSAPAPALAACHCCS